MDAGNFAPAILILLLIGIQLVSGNAIVPGRFSFRLVPRAKRRKYYRAVIRLWLAVAILYSMGVVLVHYFSNS